MPFYQSKGKIPPKRHTVFKKNNHEIYFEELISRQGFSHLYTNAYHINMPTRIKKIGELQCFEKDSQSYGRQHRHIKTQKIKSKENAGLDFRLKLFSNEDVMISVADLSKEMSFFFKNASYDELIYVQFGNALFESNFGEILLNEGDYLVVPRGVIWKLSETNKFKCLILESKSPISTPRRYRNEFGQLLEHSPYCERDIVTPVLKDPIDKSGEFEIKVKYCHGIQSYVYDRHPFDIVGWDGYYFPWKLSIYDFEPITGSIHQPPPVHQTFQGNGFVVCSFVSRLFDYHPDAIPAPYPHSNVDSDELIYYSKGNFMSRKGVESESITLHPMGLPHGPQPGKYEESIGKKNTDELAVMIDTFKPLKPTSIMVENEEKNYYKSWVND
ncbi:MAG: homogentisate 1,2-dioxygenase [Pelagibacteraceae bacterium TMED124]|nr:homogentisate 1,2-dioxygenase [Candidatus Neomarinimicrobiota bacterium]RPG18592.1 MAG: homogentisate 1,2-dioxygenase [Pelagibacteraceae bacterium TMED124]|tara:strand:- start:320 stop:1474 length:1155 start_codon:yes stop_codon:yes gene_type:complete